MTACVVAQFPWTAISNVTKLETRGIIACSDTRLTKNKEPVSGVFSKQGKLPSKHYICLTSSNLYATLSALKKVDKTKNVKKIGNALREIHDKYGDITEMIVIVSRRFQSAKILELMPPNYKPMHRTGVIGIGDRAVLQSFRENFFEQPRPDLLQPPLPPEGRRNLERITDMPYTPPRYRINDGTLNVIQALSEGIRIANSLTVGLPIQAVYISNCIVQPVNAHISSDGEIWKQITADRKNVQIPHCRPFSMENDAEKRTTQQLFD